MDAQNCYTLCVSLLENSSGFLEYPIPKKREIIERQRGDPTKCCVELLEDWLSTDNGVKPKTWSKLLSLLKEIREFIY